LSVQLPQPVDRVLRVFHVDFAPVHRQPSAGSVLVATVASVVGSLAADALLVVIGQAVFPATRGYVHFQFSDYAKLTVIGVVFACVAWPVVTRISSAPRWLFSRMAVAVTLVLWVPDLYILLKGQPAKAVAVLFVMHLAIAVVTYFCLVLIARTGPAVTVPPADSGKQFAPRGGGVHARRPLRTAGRLLLGGPRVSPVGGGIGRTHEQRVELDDPQPVG
jgi:hypothetical protein